jgi:hypothetical protein
MPSLVEFLNHVLPSEGYYCWWYKDKFGRPQQGFTSTIEQLAAALVQIDALSCDAFFACSAYKEPTSRRSENVKQTKSFWLDIDAGNGKPYADAAAALCALDTFCEKIGWDLPTVVHSGGGIHCYWSRHDSFTPAAWLTAARELKDTIAKYGLCADPARTSDISSILRPPGTFNWKLRDQPRPVSCDELMDGAMPLRGLAKNSAEYAPQTQTFKSATDLTKNITAIYGQREPSYASVAVSQCNQLRHFRDTRGNIPEPLWYAGLGLLAECEDGHRLAHEWSNGHPAYTVEETDRKFNQAKTAAGATTCERFKSLNPSACAGCPFTITSPIVLGRQAAPGLAAAQQPVEQFPPLPEGYGMNQKYELTAKVKRTDDKGVESDWMMPFTNHPIYLSQVRDGETERNQGLFFRQWEKHKGWVEFEITSQNFSSMGTWGELAKHGCFMRNDNAKRLFAKYVSESYQILKEGAYAVRYDQFGWKNNKTGFYYGGRLYQNGKVEAAAGSQECTKRGDKMKPSKQGSLVNWSAAANKLFVDGCEAQSFALLASFASPLMAFITPPGEGGAVLSLVSPTGGTGKSTALTAVASVWGDLEAIRLISRDTMTSKFRIIAILNSIPVVFDELRDRHPEIIVEFMQSFTTGRDRNRARTDGSINPIEMGWCNICVSASNKSLVDAINSAEKASVDAMADRVFEVEMRKPKDVVFSHNGSIGNDLIFNRGHAGHAYISYLLQPGIIEWAEKALLTLVDHYILVTGASTSHRYMIREVAGCAVAGAICKHLGLMEFSVERIIEWALAQITDRVKHTLKFEPWQTLVNIIDDHALASCVVVNRAFHPRVKSELVRSPRFDTHMRYEIEERKLYIAADWIREKLNEMSQPTAFVMKDLEEKGILLQRNRRTSLNAGLDLPGGKVPCWEIDMTHTLLTEVYIKEVLPTAEKIA